MKRFINTIVSAAALFATLPALAQVAIRADRVYTMAGPPIDDGVIVITGGKIVAVGPAAAVRIPDGHEIMSAVVATPGLIDAHTVVGLAGQLNSDEDQDQLDNSSPIQPQLRAVDAYNARERLVEWIRSYGVTTIHTGHAPGELISGQTLIAKTTGNSVEDAVMVPVAMVAATLSEDGTREGDGESPGNRSKMMSMLRQKLIDAQAYTARHARAAARGDANDDDKKDGNGGPPKRDLEMEILAEVAAGRTPLLVTAHREQDIANALRLADEFGLKLVLDGAAESARLADRIRAAGVPVIVHATMIRAYGESENMSFETAATLRAAGIPIALQSGYESYVPKTRVVLYEAGWAAANGLGFEAALETITIGAARVLGIDARVGSLEVGKDGDVALYDGDPFEYTTHCTGVVIEGDVVSRVVR
ncbi:MAG: amidohydrolase family protein [Planctomycetota bacterium]